MVHLFWQALPLGVLIVVAGGGAWFLLGAAAYGWRGAWVRGRVIEVSPDLVVSGPIIPSTLKMVRVDHPSRPFALEVDERSWRPLTTRQALEMEHLLRKAVLLARRVPNTASPVGRVSRRIGTRRWVIDVSLTGKASRPLLLRIAMIGFPLGVVRVSVTLEDALYMAALIEQVVTRGEAEFPARPV